MCNTQCLIHNIIIYVIHNMQSIIYHTWYIIYCTLYRIFHVWYAMIWYIVLVSQTQETRFLQPPFLQLGDHIRCQQVHVDAILTLAAGKVSRGKKRCLLVVEKTVWTTAKCQLQHCIQMSESWMEFEWHSQSTKVCSVHKFWGLMSLHKGKL